METLLLTSLILPAGLALLASTAANEPGAKPEKEPQAGGEPSSLPRATFAGGCFWCIQADFQKLGGVVKVTSGYTGGHTENPTYEEVSSGSTGHVEAVQVVYDPSRLSYEQLLDFFWKHIDPTDPGGQFADRGAQYRTVIFYHNEEQRAAAESSRLSQAKSGNFKKTIATEILPFSTFYEAEGYHQDYDKKNSLRYRNYRFFSGRDQFLEKVWGKDS